MKEEGRRYGSHIKISCAHCHGHRSGSPRLKLPEFFLEPSELASTRIDADLEAGYVCSQLQAIPEAGLGLSQTVRNQDTEPVQGVLGG